MSENQLASLRDTSAMGNRLCCGGSWSCPSAFQKRNKAGSPARPTLSTVKQQQLQQNGTKDYETTAPTYEQVLHPPASPKKSPDSTSEENNLHYADIYVLSQMQPHSRKKAKQPHSETATEYATLHFPRPHLVMTAKMEPWCEPLGGSTGFRNFTTLWEQSAGF